MRRYVGTPNEKAELVDRGRSSKTHDNETEPFSSVAIGGGSAAPDAPCDGFESFVRMRASGSPIGADAQQC